MKFCVTISVAALLIVFYVSSSDALKCYSCITGNPIGANCDDKKDEQTCQGDNQVCFSSAYKIKDVWMREKHCEEKTAAKTKCDSVKDQNSVKCYTCSSDLCNGKDGAAGFSASLALALGLAVAVLKLR